MAVLIVSFLWSTIRLPGYTERKRALEDFANVYYGPTEAEKMSLAFRSSICVSAVLEAGDLLSSENVCIMLPDNSLPSNDYQTLLGWHVAKDAKRATPMI